MKILIVGATGATGRLLVQQFLDRGMHVKAVIRSERNIPPQTLEHPNLTTVKANILDIGEEDLAKHLVDCDAIVSCLGHTLSFKGIYGAPRRLVTDATKRLCQAAISSAQNRESPLKFVLMNTTGNRNRDLAEPISFGQKCVIALLRLLLPPHVDNENAADFLRADIGQNNSQIEWVVVRPDTLLNDEHVSEYNIHPSPIRSAIFDAGKTSRINVAHFMATLIAAPITWREWKGQMPVIYNTNDQS